MKVLLPTQSPQTITIIPRSVGYAYLQNGFDDKVRSMRAVYEDNICADDIISDEQGQDITVTLREDGSGETENIIDVDVFKIGNFAEVTFTSTILKKDRVYYFQMDKGDALMYRGKVYCTDSFDGDKYNMSKEDYKQNSASDNKYTLI